MTKELVNALAAQRTQLQEELAGLPRGTPEHQEKKNELEACKLELATARRLVPEASEAPEAAHVRFLSAVAALEKIDVSEPEESALQQIDECRMTLRSFALGVSKVLDARAALAEAKGKLARMSDTQRAAMAQVLSAKGIPSAEAFGQPGAR